MSFLLDKVYVVIDIYEKGVDPFTAAKRSFLGYTKRQLSVGIKFNMNRDLCHTKFDGGSSLNTYKKIVSNDAETLPTSYACRDIIINMKRWQTVSVSLESLCSVGEKKFEGWSCQLVAKFVILIKYDL